MSRVHRVPQNPSNLLHLSRVLIATYLVNRWNDDPKEARDTSLGAVLFAFPFNSSRSLKTREPYQHKRYSCTSYESYIQNSFRIALVGEHPGKKMRFQAKEAQGVGKKLQRIEHGLASHQRELWIGPVTRTNHSIVRDLG